VKNKPQKASTERVDSKRQKNRQLMIPKLCKLLLETTVKPNLSNSVPVVKPVLAQTPPSMAAEAEAAAALMQLQESGSSSS
jgi:hypothetical protein